MKIATISGGSQDGGGNVVRAACLPCQDSSSLFVHTPAAARPSWGAAVSAFADAVTMQGVEQSGMMHDQMPTG